MRWRILLLMLLPLCACHASQNSRFYTLSSTNSAVATTAQGWSLDDVLIPELIDRPQIVVTSQGGRVHILEYDRWAEPLDSMIRRVLTEDLLSHFLINKSAYKQCVISVSIEEFGANDAGEVSLKATWSLRADLHAKTPMQHVFERKENAGATDISATVAVMSRLLGEFADAIADR